VHLLILNLNRREQVDITRYTAGGTARTITAVKAVGGLTTYGAANAAYEWCLLDGRYGDRIVFLFDAPDDPTIKAVDASDCLDGGDGTELDAEETERLRQEAAGFTDVTETVFERLVAAERLATVADFRGITFDMGTPIGYIERLYHIWRTRGGGGNP
jgi:hypothetical protein